jgi:hypothetical protein
MFRYDVFETMRETQTADVDGPLSDLFAFGPTKKLTAKLGDEPELIRRPGCVW